MSAFPDASALFSFRPKKIGEIKDECFVVLDTSVLLVPYTIGPKTLQEIKKTYKMLANEKRLFVPGQVAREFARNRANKLSELFNQLSKKRDAAGPFQADRYPLFEDLAEYRSVVELEKSLNVKIGEYRKALGAVLDQVKAWNWDDPVSLLYGELFTGETIIECSTDDASIKSDLAARAASKIPPGYKDAGKSTNSAGDLIIWLTILELGKKGHQDVLLVSGDAKPDWWHQSNSKPLYPRFELVDEFRRASDGHSFHIVTLSDFLALYGAQSDVVQEVQFEEMTSQAQPDAIFNKRRIDGRAVEQAVANWLRQFVPTVTEAPVQEGFRFDLLATTVDNRTIAIDITTFSAPPRAADVHDFTVTFGIQRSTLGRYNGLTDYVAFYVFTYPIDLRSVKLLWDEIVHADPMAKMSIGWLNELGKYDQAASNFRFLA